MLTKGAIGNLVNRYKAVLKKCNLINTFGSLAVASMLVLGGSGVAGAEQVNVTGITPPGTKVTNAYGGWKTITGTGNSIVDSTFDGFTLDTSNAAGGAVIYNNGAETIINGGAFKNNTITSKKNGRGGAIYNYSGKLTITGTEFSSNQFTMTLTKSGYGGGAIGAVGGEVTLDDCTFTGNTTNREGGAIYTQQGKITVKNSTFTANESTGNRGGAIVVQKGSTLTLQGENTFKENKAASAGGAISVVYPAGTEGPCSIIFDTGSVTTFEGNEASCGGALDIVDTFVTKEDSQLIFRGNKALSNGGGAISLTTTSASANAGIKPNVEFNSKTTFENNSSEGNGGAIWLYSGACSVVFNEDATFSGNTDANGKNDIHSDGTIGINDAAVTLDGGITSSKGSDDEYKGTITGNGSLVFTNTDTVVQAKEISKDIKAVATAELNDMLGGNVSAFKNQIGDEFNAQNISMKEGLVAPSYENGQQSKNRIMDATLQQASVKTVALDKILTNDVRKRLGDIRSDANTSGVWMRWDGGKLKGDSGLTNNFNTIQIGGDTKVAKNWRLGVAGSFTHGDTDFDRGNGELEGFSFATYATWMGENGMFADVVARLGHFSTEMNVEGLKGDMDNRVFSLSGEYGWRFNLCDQFFVEPQIELAYTYVSSDDIELGTAARYSIDNVDSLTGRAGLVAGWNLPADRGNVYARASVVQQFMGDAKISGAVPNGTPVTQKIDGNDTWLEYGIGANVKLTDKTYLWADVERTEGADIEEEWRGTVGVRFSF